jgi:hypothetical protein
MLTHYHPLLVHRLASLQHAERSTELGQIRRARRRSAGTDAVRLGTRLRIVGSSEPATDDLAHWLERSGQLIATKPEQAAGRYRSLLAAVVAELQAAAADAGVRLDVSVGPHDSAALLRRVHAVLAQRTAGRSIGVRAHRRSRLETLLSAFASDSRLAAPTGETARAA